MVDELLGLQALAQSRRAQQASESSLASDLQIQLGRDKIIFTWVGWVSLLIASCLMCSYLNSMKGGMIARFHCADRD